MKKKRQKLGETMETIVITKITTIILKIQWRYSNSNDDNNNNNEKVRKVKAWE